MSNVKNKESMAYKNKLAYIKRRNKETKRFYVTLNPVTEQKMIDFLEGKAKATFVKKLILKAMAEDEA